MIKQDSIVLPGLTEVYIHSISTTFLQLVL